MQKQMSRFAMPRGVGEPASAAPGGECEGAPGPDLDDPRVERAMMDLERDMAGVDENNPRQMGQLMRRMRDVLPPGSVPKELDVAIRRLEAGEDPDKIEEDMGDLLGGMMGGPDGGAGGGGYSHDAGLYDY
jgi:hypothetical protein